MRQRQSGQVLVIVAVWLIALIGSAALILLAGSVEWQRNQLQQIVDQAALDAALKIGVGCGAGSASTVITEADTFVATQRSRTGALSIGAGSCAAGYTGTDTFAPGITETIHYPYRSHQQQVEVILTEVLPISFGNYAGASNTNVKRRAVAQQLNGSTAALTATTLSCTAGQFNVAGSVAASNAIALSGTCGLYAHSRFDAASSTYSDVGNVSVYAGGQSWVNAGGLCVAGANAGSTKAVCADGSELSGHVAMTCGTSGTSAYLSAGDAAINPNPCAAGKAPIPVPPVSTARPPDPNTDPAAIATLQGTGGAACNAGAVMPNIQVSGTTVATGLGPVPAKDASNFYHFKPSCYGYLNPNLLPAGGSISNRQTGPEVGPATKDVFPSLPVLSTAGTLLVVTIISEVNPSNKPFTAPAGWVQAASASLDGARHTDIWYYPNNPGGIGAAGTVDFGASPASINVWAQMTEWNGVVAAAPLDRTGSVTVVVPGKTATIATSAATTMANELVITNVGFAPAGAGNTYTPGAGWTSLVNDPGSGYGSEDRLNLPAAVASETVTYTSDTTWSAVIATFKPSGAGVVAGAVLDPGFYYFNGSGFAGGGGICLNGSTLLARDVTLEFVNQAGLSTGTCAAGGGAGCAVATCQLGSTPCSISACPPNAAADPSGGGYTWFAAPCSSAPAGDASCPGSAWCPAGDRACWNLLVWAPASSTGQIAIKGASARHWLLGSVFWTGTCTDTVNGTSTLDGTLACGTLTVSAAAGAGTAIGSDYGVSTALVEAVLVE
ncbi:MAG TPA: hypothetical protein VLK30_01180 [Candidatus Limnocylindrales bacterium]|nr:hypothetical protein [Candidatus Limnocylindrales bacterium]